MRKVVLLIAVFTFFLFLAVTPRTLFAQGTGGVSFSSGTPEFNFQIPISGLKSLTLCEKKGAVLSCPGIAKYVQVAYTFLVGFAAVLAVLAMTWGGVQWLISRGESGKIQEARKIMGNAFAGLIIALGSYTVLSVINPSLTQFNPLSIKPIKEIQLSITDMDKGRLGPTASRGYTISASASPPSGVSSSDFPKIKWLKLSTVREADKKFGKVYNEVFTRTHEGDIKKWDTKFYGEIYSAHEYTHGINAAESTHGFILYAGDKKAIGLKNPRIKLPQVAREVPKSVRDLEASSYIPYVAEYYGWEEYPLVLLDELAARTVGNKVAVDERYSKNGEDWNATVEFVLYSLTVARTIELHDKDYLTREPQFKEALQYFIQDAMRARSETLLPGAVDKTGIHQLLKTDNDPQMKALRDLAKLWYGDAWTRDLLGF